MKTKNNSIKRIVLTGGPGVGKSTIINLLSDKGYSIVPEAARIVIEREQKIDSDCLPWKNLPLFQEVVSKTQLSLENSVNSEIVFSDRGIIDGHAYSQLDGIKSPELIYQHGRNRYSQVFILDPLDNYQNDSARKEDKETALKVHQEIYKSYKTFGYNPVTVPVLSPEDRLDFILNQLKASSQLIHSPHSHSMKASSQLIQSNSDNLKGGTS